MSAPWFVTSPNSSMRNQSHLPKSGTSKHKSNIKYEKGQLERTVSNQLVQTNNAPNSDVTVLKSQKIEIL